MSRLPGLDRGWHALVEHYTPDGTVGRVLFAFLFGLAFGPTLLGAGYAQLAGPLSFFVLAELIALGAVAVGASLVVISLLALWPVYLSLIGNVESPEEYAVGGSSRRGSRHSTDVAAEATDDPEAVRTLKRRYAAGELSGDEFERRLDDILDAGASNAARSPSTDERDVETE